jgi:hypothetical protein
VHTKNTAELSEPDLQLKFQFKVLPFYAGILNHTEMAAIQSLFTVAGSEATSWHRQKMAEDFPKLVHRPSCTSDALKSPARCIHSSQWPIAIRSISTKYSLSWLGWQNDRQLTLTDDMQWTSAQLVLDGLSTIHMVQGH